MYCWEARNTPCVSADPTRAVSRWKYSVRVTHENWRPGIRSAGGGVVGRANRLQQSGHSSCPQSSGRQSTHTGSFRLLRQVFRRKLVFFLRANPTTLEKLGQTYGVVPREIIRPLLMPYESFELPQIVATALWLDIKIQIMTHWE